MNNALFLKYINNIFVSYLNELRETEKFKACEAMLLKDNYSSHISDDVIAILTRKRVRIVIFIYYMTHISQLLDMVLFGALKKYATGLEILDKEPWAAAFLLKVYRDFKQAIVKVNIWEAFVVIVFIHDID
jgi:hypothetical protein